MKDCKRCGFGRVIRFSRGPMCHACAWHPGDSVRAARESHRQAAHELHREAMAQWRAHERDRKAIRQDTSRFNAEIDLHRKAGLYDPAPAHQMGLNLR